MSDSQITPPHHVLFLPSFLPAFFPRGGGPQPKSDKQTSLHPDGSSNSNPNMKSAPLCKQTPRRHLVRCFVPTSFFLVFAVVLFGEGLSTLRGRLLRYSSSTSLWAASTDASGGGKEKRWSALVPMECDVFQGKWVFEEGLRSHYEESECPYIQPQLTCQQHGRPEKGYRQWRWQPKDCSLPTFNASLMLEALRGKRVLFVGDSLNRGQFVSLICLLHHLLPNNSKSTDSNDSLTIFFAKDYNTTIEFYWAPFLLESNADNAVVHRITDRIVRAGSIKKHGKHWKGADVFVFNTYLWWMTGEKMKILKSKNGSFDGDAKDIHLMETEDAYRMAMRSLVKWVDGNVNPSKATVFFTSMSPSHTSSEEWGGAEDGNCYGETRPIEDPTYWGSMSSRGIMRVIEEEFGKAKFVPITLLNITQLSEYRKDAHTSIYKKQWSPLTKEQRADPKSYADCIHWCLPGLQDTWNELLYTKLLFPSPMDPYIDN